MTPDDTILLRAAGAADAGAIASLHAQSWRAAYCGILSDDYLDLRVAADLDALWRERLARPSRRQRVVLAHDGGALAGFACLYLADDPALGTLLENLHVRRERHRRGWGSRLLAAAADLCRDEAPGAGLHLSVVQANRAAQAFYRARGAADAGTETWNAPDGRALTCLRLAWPAGRWPASG